MAKRNVVKKTSVVKQGSARAIRQKDTRSFIEEEVEKLPQIIAHLHEQNKTWRGELVKAAEAVGKVLEPKQGEVSTKRQKNNVAKATKEVLEELTQIQELLEEQRQTIEDLKKQIIGK